MLYISDTFGQKDTSKLISIILYDKFDYALRVFLRMYYFAWVLLCSVDNKGAMKSCVIDLYEHGNFYISESPKVVKSS